MASLSSDETTLLDNYDRFTGIPFNVIKVTEWYDGSPMDDSKVDNVIYFKNTANLGGGYAKRDYDTFIDAKWFGAKGDGVIDDTDAIQEWLRMASLLNTTAYLPAAIYMIYRPLNLYKTNIEGEQGSTVIFAEDLILDTYPDPLDSKRQMLMYNGGFNRKEAYEEITADSISIKNIIFIAEVLDMQGTFRNEGSILGLANVKDGVIDNCTFAIYNAIPNNQLTPLDWFNGVNNVIVTNSKIINTNPNHIGGGIWIRSWNVNAATQNNTFKNCTFINQSGDEALAVFGLNGAVKNTVIDGNIFLSQRSENKHNTLISFFPSGNISYAHSEVNGVNFTNNIIEDHNFEINVIRAGQVDSAVNRTCDNIYIANNTILAGFAGTNPAGTSVIRKIKNIGENTKAVGNTITLIGEETIIDSGIREVDVAEGNTITGKNTFAINGTKSAINNDIITTGTGIRDSSDYIINNRIVSEKDCIIIATDLSPIISGNRLECKDALYYPIKLSGGTALQAAMISDDNEMISAGTTLINKTGNGIPVIKIRSTDLSKSVFVPSIGPKPIFEIPRKTYITDAGGSADAGYWLKVGSVALTGVITDFSTTLLFSSSITNQSFAEVFMSARIGSTGSITLRLSVINLVGLFFKESSFKLINTGDAVFSLWVKKETTNGKLYITELNSAFSSINDEFVFDTASTWVATEPTGINSITSLMSVPTIYSTRTTAFTITELNSTYINLNRYPIGTDIVCPNISSGGRIYKRLTDTIWVDYEALITPDVTNRQNYIPVSNTTDVVTKTFLNTNYPAATYPIGTIVDYYNQGMLCRRATATVWTVVATTLLGD